MWRNSTAGVLVLAALLAPAAEGKGDAPGAPAEALSGWEWIADVNPAAGPADGLVDFLVTPAVFDRARPDLGDLRLVDGGGRTVPYALRVRRTQDDKRPLAAREFNRAVRADHSMEVTLDLGEAPGEHNEIEVTTPGRDFRRRLLLEGSNDAKTWSVMLDKGYLMHFEVGQKVAEVHAFAYPVSRFRYLRVQVFPDRSLETDAPDIARVGVFRSVQVPGEDVTLPVNLAPREAVRAPDGPGSAWVLDLGGQVPVERLTVDAADDEFTRPYQLEVVGEENVRRILAQGEWRRRRGPERRPLEIAFPEVTARRLRLVVTDYRNPPLNLLNVRYSAPAREVVFSRPASAAPLRLYLGNPNARPPHYDFAASLPDNLDPPPVRTSLGEPARNPEYRPPPKPWTERWPWLVYVVLGTASLVLLAILAGLAREALARHDRAAAGVTP